MVGIGSEDIWFFCFVFGLFDIDIRIQNAYAAYVL